MVRKIALIALVGVLILGLSGCILRPAGSSESRTESRDVDGFDSVDFEGWGDLTIEQGNEFKMTVTGPEDLVKRLKTEVRGDTLRIYMEPRAEFWWFGFGNRSLDIAVTLPELKAFELDGAGTVDIDGVETEVLELDLSGAAELSATGLDVDELVLDMSGAGEAQVSGQARTQDIEISGAGNFDGGHLEGSDVTTVMSGAGSATVWATRNLDVVVSGAGSVKYYGDPDVNRETSGAGSIEGLGDR